MVGAGADAPYSLVYRIGGVTHDSWDYDWVDAESVLGKCKTTYAPPAVILQRTLTLTLSLSLTLSLALNPYPSTPENPQTRSPKPESSP